MNNIRIEWLDDQVKGAVRSGAADVLLDIANDVITQSLTMVPRDTPELASSAYTDMDRDSLIAIAGYGAPRDVKAIEQHEDLTYQHPPGKSAKFLEKPLHAARSKAAWKLAEGLRGVFR